MTAVNQNGVLTYATDPDAGGLVFDFVAGLVDLVIAFEVAGATGTLTETLDNATSTAAGASGSAGTLAVTLANATSAASGASGAAGTVAQTLADATATAGGTSTPPGVAGSLAVTLTDTTSAAAGTFTDATAPEPEPPPALVPSMPIPPTGGTGRTVRLTLTADLGTITAHTGLRLELADEELIELL